MLWLVWRHCHLNGFCLLVVTTSQISCSRADGPPFPFFIHCCPSRSARHCVPRWCCPCCVWTASLSQRHLAPTISFPQPLCCLPDLNARKATADWCCCHGNTSIVQPLRCSVCSAQGFRSGLVSQALYCNPCYTRVQLSQYPYTKVDLNQFLLLNLLKNTF